MTHHWGGNGRGFACDGSRNHSGRKVEQSHTFFLAVILAIASIEDLISLRIPNWVTLPGMVVGMTSFGLADG
ncbi:MAG: A24 family peptidase, partial [Thermodesulfobacteriota bacterium]